ncbi:uncharacterized protein F5Z01DRAFT_705898 [Emericellopsis atlantica]|uniref:Uncharacterized protein n=1 Tax=Emericellopsis atlantica TaxID=2614577 RepID=A0A9P7ZNN0_9HYPO|nr:uncharacterized protein F5Z01DRAFT_705898 [Emericellopsis atlantica]KAG9255459.1 hypothetical protein F5Z01DRAFT_705898 [Emericellopsis atlantica]
MFGSSRRGRAPVKPLTKETANPNAATAAASAFMRREPSTSLSSAAAAAALKARPMTPTNVAEAQSKRSMRRSASVSSTNSRGRPQSRSTDLRRSPSTGSMTERTFRSPSPGRSPAPRQVDVPPVPRLPKTVQRPASSHNPAGLTIQTQPFRTASQKAQDGNSQGSWFSAPANRASASARHSQQVLEYTPAYDDDDGSISPSINFSYPRSRMESPSPSPTGKQMVYDANSRRMVPKAELRHRSQSARPSPDKPVKASKSGVSRSGSHLDKGTISRIRGTAVESPSPRVTASRDSTPPAQRQRAGSQPQPVVRSAQAPNQHAGSSLSREETLVEPEAQRQPVSATVPVTPQRAVAEQPREVKNTELENAAIDAVPVRSHRAPQAALAAFASDPKRESVRRARVQSESPARSPARSAHFAPTANQLLVRHEPPPRSLSPRKSALKNSSNARGASPSDDGSEVSEALNGGDPKEEISRKKSFRVSFNDESNVVVGESAEPPEVDSPIVPSPQQATKKTWHSILNRHKKEASKLDEDETMGPRPALPLFGSVREKKTREAETNERPLVRPGERAFSPSPVPSPLRRASAEAEAETVGNSNDSAIGSVLSSESPSRNEANISRAREPLPPVVTSVEGSGYDSSSFMDTDDDEVDHTNATDTTEVSQQVPETVHTNGNVVHEKTEDAKADGDIPSISISGPSPAARDSGENSPEAEYFDVPGGFPDDVDTTVAPKPETVEIHEETQAPIPLTATAVSNVVMNDIIEEEESENSSIYSDAYEDISDAEDGGFMSLNAVLTAPADSKVSRLYQKTKRKSQESTRPAVTDLEKGANGQEPAATQDDWENAKTYWRSLSVDKRRQLEKEALEEAGEDADQEESAAKPKKNKKRRSTDRPVSTSSIASSHNPDRIYQIMPGTSWAHEDASQQPTADAPAPPLAEAPVPKLKKSMRGERPSPVDAARSPQTNGTMRTTMRANGGASAGAREPAHARASSARPASYQPSLSSEVARNTLANRRTHSTDSRPSSSAGPSTAGVAPTLRRRGSDSSESSFRRARPASQGFGFRSSMRSAPEPAVSPEPTRGSSRFSIRSLSPTGSAFGRRSFNPPPAQAPMSGSRMRTSMRLANSQPKESKMKLSPFGKKNKGGSRFAESSDEEESGVGSRFASRRTRDYSSDEEDVARPPPQRGLSFKSMRSTNGAKSAAAAASGFPSKPARAPSPDLPDSDDEIVQPKRHTTIGAVNGRQTGTLQRSRSGRGSFPPPASPGYIAADGLGQRPAHQRRGSFMSNILRRKKDSSSMITRDVSESAARRDTRLERSQEELNIIRHDSGRLQKTQPSWPLPDGNVTAAPQRPSTSAGPSPGGLKMGFLKRRSVSHQGATTTAFPEEGRKKKFGKLRKMFGLND